MRPIKHVALARALSPGHSDNICIHHSLPFRGIETGGQHVNMPNSKPLLIAALCNTPHVDRFVFRAQLRHVPVRHALIRPLTVQAALNETDDDESVLGMVSVESQTSFFRNQTRA